MIPTPPVFSRNPAEWKALRNKHVVFVGLGSVGSALCVMAARAGVGRFTLIDPERLEAANIGRHCCGLSDLGIPKVTAVARLIRQVNPRVEIHQHPEDFRTLVRRGFTIEDSKVSLLIGATDSLECQSLVNLASLESGVPSVFAGCWGAAAVGEILYVVPRRTACYECYARFRRTQAKDGKADKRKYTDPNFDGTKRPPDAGLWANILVVCGFAFQVVLSLLEASELGPFILEDGASLFLVNVASPASPLPFWGVSKGSVDRGCGVCADFKPLGF